MKAFILEMLLTLMRALRDVTFCTAVCGGLVQCAKPVTPAAQPKVQAAGPANESGCASGMRDGFKDVRMYPNIAACAGAWTEPGLQAPVTAGGSSASALCAAGWQICATSAAVAERTNDRGCEDASPNPDLPVFFATLESGPGYAHCDGEGTNDVFGCGSLGAKPATDCGVLNRFSHNNCSKLKSPWTCDGETTEVMTVTKPAADGGGVLCCR